MGLRFGEDGALTIHIQHEQPESDMAADWLSAPAEPFYALMGIHGPEESVMIGEWAPPLVMK